MLKWIVYAGLGLCLVVKSNVSGMIDTSWPNIDVKEGAMSVQAHGSMPLVPVDLGEVTKITGSWSPRFIDSSGRFASDDARTRLIAPPTRAVKVKLRLEGTEVRNADNKAVAYAGLLIGGNEMNKDAAVRVVQFESGKRVPITWILYKYVDSVGSRFAAGDELPMDWIITAGSTELKCSMTLRAVANRD
jgi:hypothetical protein